MSLALCSVVGVVAVLGWLVLFGLWLIRLSERRIAREIEEADRAPFFWPEQSGFPRSGHQEKPEEDRK